MTKGHVCQRVMCCAAHSGACRCRDVSQKFSDVGRGKGVRCRRYDARYRRVVTLVILGSSTLKPAAREIVAWHVSREDPSAIYFMVPFDLYRRTIWPGAVMDCERLDEALDVIAQVRKSDDLMATIAHLRDLYGCEHLVYAGLRMPDLVETDPYLIFTYPGEWIERYRREDFFRIDPVFVAGKSGFLPIDWLTLDRKSSEAQHVFAEAARYSISGTGMSFPMRGPDGDAGILAFTADFARGGMVAVQAGDTRARLRLWASISTNG